MKLSRVIISSALGLAITAGSAFADPGEGNHGHAYGHQHSQARQHGHYRQLQTGYLSDSQIAYAIHNRNSELAQVRSLRSIDYSRVRIVRLTAAQKARLGIGALPNTTVALEPFAMGDGQAIQTAQIFGGSGNNQLGNVLQTVLSGILVQNAVNGATGTNAGGSLANILLNSGIPLSSLLGIFMGGNGILNAIVG